MIIPNMMYNDSDELKYNSKSFSRNTRLENNYEKIISTIYGRGIIRVNGCGSSSKAM